ncbi:serine/threonine protein kinase [Xylariaceae sp. FL0016]|nr:serine/threonine protein kinase [Xylariaceae sp. FL0016]
MHPSKTLTVDGDAPEPVTKLAVSTPLNKVPAQVFDLANSLVHLDLSGSSLSTLPDSFKCLRKLRIAFFSNCSFDVFPEQLALCPELEMVAFRNNGMTRIPEGALPPRLRWLILTNNRIETIPKSIGKCSYLQKCMLSGNRLTHLPEEMVSCRSLALLRLSANCIEQLPSWLFDLPELAFLSFAGNPASVATTSQLETAMSTLAEVSLKDLELQELLGEGASGIISKAHWNTADEARQVAVKLFKGNVTSDGTPQDEMQACIMAGSHANLINTLGKICDHPDRDGLIMELVPNDFVALGLPPSLQSCTRDCFTPGTRLTAVQGLNILQGVASAAEHLHVRGVAHGDLYAHNILVNREGVALLGDLGAASIYGQGCKMEQLEVLAFAHLIEDVWNLIRVRMDEGELGVLMQLAGLHRRCSLPIGSERPAFLEIQQSLHKMDRQLKKIPA